MFLYLPPDGQQVTLDNIGPLLALYSSHCKVKLTVQRSAPLRNPLVETDEKLVAFFLL